MPHRPPPENAATADTVASCRRKPLSCCDVLVIGAGPAALVIAAALTDRGLAVAMVAPSDPAAPWLNTYGIWAAEVEALGLEPLLSHRWQDCVSYFGPGGGAGDGLQRHSLAYGLFDKAALQAHLLARLEQGGVRWHRGRASAVEHDAHGSNVRLSLEPAGGGTAPQAGAPAEARPLREQTAIAGDSIPAAAAPAPSTSAGQSLRAALVIDASGHDPVFIQRPSDGPVAGQAAYGLVGRFSAPPIEPGRFVFMDFRGDHLDPERLQREPPTFLYAMDLGEGVFFVEETSLALAPAVPFEQLRDRLQRRLAHRGVAVQEVLHEEFCLFPMNPALPDREQRVVGFGGAASMVHPASGYMVGGLLRRAPELAAAIGAALQRGEQGEALARSAWQGLWPASLRWRHAFFRFGLEKLMRFDEARLRHHFASFFRLPEQDWYGFLTNTLPPPRLLAAMVRLYGLAPWDVRWGLMALQGREGGLLARLLRPG